MASWLEPRDSVQLVLLGLLLLFSPDSLEAGERAVVERIQLHYVLLLQVRQAGSLF